MSDLLPADLAGPDGPARLIEDRYLVGTTLRLRRVTVGSKRVHKLTQKVRPVPGDPYDVATTNIYLEPTEYELLRTLPADELTKVRQLVGGFAVDTFQGHLTGLGLAEIELAEGTAQPPLPRWLGREVTHDDRYSGGRLARATAPDVAALLDPTG